jgi:hypothetical protein
MWFAFALPASAIETATFGLTAAGAKESASALHTAIPSGTESQIEVDVWNRTAAPLTLDLRAVPAVVDTAGSASLGGNDGAAQWASFPQGSHRPTIAAKSRTRVALSIAVPKNARHGRHTFAVLAEPVLGPGEAPPAVLQRLAVMAYVQVDGPAHGSTAATAASVGAVAVLGAGALAAAAAMLARQLRRRQTVLLPG